MSVDGSIAPTIAPSAMPSPASTIGSSCMKFEMLRVFGMADERLSAAEDTERLTLS